MSTNSLWISSLAYAAACTLGAQDLAGDWQGSINAGAKQLRVVVEIAKADTTHSGWTGVFHSIDQGTDGIRIDSVALQGSDVKFSLEQIRGTYEGKISGDGNSIKGTWSQGAKLALDLERATKETAWWRHDSPHTARFLTVDKDVKLEVLDWGGAGRPLVLLSGLGNTAHVFDDFATKLTSSYHVYGITRRGFGWSAMPQTGYGADRLADDVLEVIDTLRLEKPVLAGHSIAGEELSSIGSRHPEKVSGLVYLDAGYGYALYDPSRGDAELDAMEVRNKLDALLASPGQKSLIGKLLQTDLPQLQKTLKSHLQDLEDAGPMPVMPTGKEFSPPKAILAGRQKFTEIKVPALAIYALPNGPVPARVANAAKSFETIVPNSRVVQLPEAHHYVFRSNEEDVLRELKAFIAGLHPTPAVPAK